jgi:hypothetical protein
MISVSVFHKGYCCMTIEFSFSIGNRSSFEPIRKIRAAGLPHRRRRA